MAATFTSNFIFQLRASGSDNTTYPAIGVSPILTPGTITFTSGSNAGQVDLVSFPAQITATGATSLNLYDGSVATIMGGAAAFRHCNFFAVYNAGTVSATLGGNFMTANFGGTQTLGPGCFFGKADPSGSFAVASGSSNVFTVTLPSGTNTGGAINLAFGGTAE